MTKSKSKLEQMEAGPRAITFLRSADFKRFVPVSEDPILGTVRLHLAAMSDTREAAVTAYETLCESWQAQGAMVFPLAAVIEVEIKPTGLSWKKEYLA